MKRTFILLLLLLCATSAHAQSTAPTRFVYERATAPTACTHKGEIYTDTTANKLYRCTVPGNPGTWSEVGGVAATRAINTTSPITGGHDLSTDVTIACATCGVTGSGLNQFASTTSAQLAGVLSDETGSGGGFARAISPAFTTPDIGVANATQIVFTNGLIKTGGTNAIAFRNSADNDYAVGLVSKLRTLDSSGNIQIGLSQTAVYEAEFASGGSVDFSDSATQANTSKSAGICRPSSGTLRVSNGTTACSGYGNLELKRLTQVVVALTDAATIAVDASAGNKFRVTLGGNRTLGNPTNATDGQTLTFELIQDATGSRTLAYDTKFAFGTDITGATLTTTASKRDFLTVQYNSTADKFYVVGFVKGY